LNITTYISLVIRLESNYIHQSSDKA